MENEYVGIIFDDEDIIGKVKDIKKLFINELAKNLLDKEFEVKEKISDINNVQELFKNLEKENDNTIIKIYNNPMGGLEFKHLTWEE